MNTYPPITQALARRLLEHTAAVPTADLLQASDESVAAGAPRWRVSAVLGGSYYFGDDLKPAPGTHPVPPHGRGITVNEVVKFGRSNEFTAVGRAASQASYRPVHSSHSHSWSVKLVGPEPVPPAPVDPWRGDT
jgi:hypothetical protein